MENEDQNIGLYWGEETLFFVEVISSAPNRIFSISLKKESTGGAIEGATLIPEESRLANLFQNTFAEQKLSPEFVNLSLPTKDIIFRSFVIPWMPASEIKAVVDFEASKYVPFAIEELAFSYYPMTITAEGKRQLRIIFVAIKKETLDTYTNTLDQFNLPIGIIEPAPMSLIRCLVHKKMIPEDQNIALIEREDQSGKITIVDQGIPQFVREFHITPHAQDQKASQEDIKSRLIKEIRISLDYFNRQENQSEVQQLFLLTTKDPQNLADTLNNDIAITTTAIDISSILQDKDKMNLGYLYSYGIGLIDSFGTKPHFIFNENKELLSKISKPKTTKKPVNIKSVAITLTCCVAWFFMTMFVSNRIVVSPSEKKASLEKQLGDKKGASTEKLKSKLTSLNKKLNYYKEVRYDSNIGQFLNELPSVMPDGTWLNTLTIAYTDSYAARGIAKGGEDKNEKFFEMDGFAYSENVNEQFQLVNELFSNLKKNLYIKEAFKNIGRDSSQKTNLSTYDVTKFTIKGN